MRTGLTMWAVLALLWGCNGGNGDDTGPVDTDADTDSDADADADADTDSDADTDIEVDGEGHFFFARVNESVYWESVSFAGGFFADSRQAVVNPFECFVAGDALFYQACWASLPQIEGDIVVYDASVGFDPSEAQFAFNGLRVEVGDEVAHLVNDYHNDALYYRNELLPGAWGGDSQKLAFSNGDWGSYDGSADFVFPTALTGVDPDPLDLLDLATGDTLTLQWDAGSTGDVYLHILGPGVNEIWALDDDGEVQIDTIDMGFATSGFVSLILQRVQWNDVDINGGSMSVQTVDQQWWEGQFTQLDLSGRNFLDPSDTCGGATTSTDAGLYWGTLGGLANDLDPDDVDDCTGWQATGGDAIVPVDVAAGQLLSVALDVPAGDASLYLLTDCADVNTCITGQDDTVSGPEAIDWINTGGDTTVYVVLDSYDAEGGGAFLLDIDKITLSAPPIAEDCDVSGVGDLTAGRYFGVLDDLADDEDLGSADCVSPPPPSGSGDGFMSVTLQPDELLEVAVSRTSAVAVAILADGCDLDSCLAADSETGAIAAEASWFNASGSAQTVTVAIEGQGLYQLDVSIEAVTGVDAADTCSLAGATAPIGAGRYYGDLTGFTDDLDPGSGGCTVFAAEGGEGIIPIQLPASSQVTIDVQMPGLDPSIYLVDDCDDADTCFLGVDAGDGAGEVLRWVNPGAATSAFLVVDGYGASTGPFTLDIQHQAMTELTVADTCSEAMSASSVTSGIYFGTTSGLTDVLDPGDGGCTGYEALAEDGIVPITLADGESVKLEYTLAGEDASIYLLTDCNSAATCIVGADESVGDSEELSYSNTSGAEQTLYVVLDGYFNGSDFTLSVDIH